MAMKNKTNFLGNEELENKLIERITSFVGNVKGARAKKEDMWDKYYKMWKASEATAGETFYQGRANARSPYGHRAIEVYASRAPQLIFETNDVAKYVPAKNKTPERFLRAQAETERMKKQFEKTGQKLKWYQFFRNQARDGFAVAALNWRLDTRSVIWPSKVEVPDYDGDGNMIGSHIETEETEREVTTYDAPDMRLVDIKRFYIDPTVRSIDEAPYVVEETFASKNQLLRMAGDDDVWDKAAIRELNGDDADATSPVDDNRFKTTGFGTADVLPDDKPFRILEYWGLLEIQDEVEVEVVGTLVAGKLIRFSRNPYWHQKKPYLGAPYIQDDQSIYGMSMLEPIYRETLMADTIKNQTLDRNTQDLCNMWLVSRAANIRDEQMKFRPNGVILTNMMDGVQALRPNPQGINQGLQMLEYIDRSTQDTTGATKMLAGTEADMMKQATAFAIRSNLTESTVKFKTVVDVTMESAVKPFLYMWADLNNQYCTEEDIVEVMGDDGKKLLYPISPDDVLSDYDVEVYAGDQLVQDNYQVQNIITYLNWYTGLIPMMQQLSQTTGMPMQMPDIFSLAKKVWEKLGFNEPIPQIQLPPMPPPQPGQVPGQPQPKQIQGGQGVPQGPSPDQAQIPMQ